jgi:hypothetical protein
MGQTMASWNTNAINVTGWASNPYGPRPAWLGPLKFPQFRYGSERVRQWTIAMPFCVRLYISEAGDLQKMLLRTVLPCQRHCNKSASMIPFPSFETWKENPTD